MIITSYFPRDCAVNYFTGLSLIRPMYYDFPESNEAYSFQTQVHVGSYW